MVVVLLRMSWDQTLNIPPALYFGFEAQLNQNEAGRRGRDPREVITLRDRVVTRGRRISVLSPPSPSLDQRPKLSRLLTDALWSLYDQSKEELGRSRDGGGEEDSSF